MSDPVKEFKRLSELAEEHKSKKNRIQGSIDQIVNSLKLKGFKSMKEATDFLKKKSIEKDNKEKKLASLIKKFQEKYEEYL